MLVGSFRTYTCLPSSKYLDESLFFASYLLPVFQNTNQSIVILVILLNLVAILQGLQPRK